MRVAALALAALALLALAAAPAEAGHTPLPVPTGALTIHVLFFQATAYAPSPFDWTDAYFFTLCGATDGLAVRCTYEERLCSPGDLSVFCP